MPIDSATRVVAITGSAGGIGAASVRAFRDAGWRVIGMDRQADAAEGAMEAFFKIDVGSPDDMAASFAAIDRRIGRLDAIVNGAALQICREIVDTSVDEWDRVLNANARSVYLSLKHGTPLLERQGGAVVNVGSVHSIATSGAIAAYAASKGAVAALTRAAALELAPRRIRVNAVLPGAIDTPMLHAGLERSGDDPAAAMARLASRHPVKRVGLPDEVAQSILFLADGDRSSFITGQTLIVDGGATARLSTE